MLSQKYKYHFHKLPDANRAEIWAWFKRPMVSQARQYGDGLTGVRTILRVYPAGRP